MQGETPSAPVQTETTAQTQAHLHHYTRALFHYQPHPHIPQKVTIAKAEQALTGFNMKIAVVITRGLGTMICAYIFAILAIIGFPGFNATPTQYVQWISQTFIQLVALSVLAVGQQGVCCCVERGEQANARIGATDVDADQGHILPLHLYFIFFIAVQEDFIHNGCLNMSSTFTALYHYHPVVECGAIGLG